MEEEIKTLTLRSKDGQVFSIKESVAVQSGMIKKLVESGSFSKTIPVDMADGKTLTIVLEYLNLHADSAISNEDKDKFDSEFVKRSSSELIDMFKEFCSLRTCSSSDGRRKFLSPFNMENDIYTPK